MTHEEWQAQLLPPDGWWLVLQTPDWWAWEHDMLPAMAWRTPPFRHPARTMPLHEIRMREPR